ncbi:hypothetical protein BKA65DRAFT_479507 [Rhexocercosporidium sp. MPI-PUGE-AT-0058]|nr:hypothetical protein BKA65DRAFT_479507 [Rhexocercosporidium sp. MPI-PUGE-AT-0058]
MIELSQGCLEFDIKFPSYFPRDSFQDGTSTSSVTLPAPTLVPGTHTTSPNIAIPTSTSTSAPQHKPPPTTPPPTTHSSTDLVIALQKNDPNPLFYIITHNPWSSKPSVILHSSNSPASPALASAKIPSLGRIGSGMTIIVFSPPSPGATSGGMSQRLELPAQTMKKSGGSFYFNAAVVGGSIKEIKGTNKKGKMAFLGDGCVFGEDFERMAVITVAGIMEKKRGTRTSNAGAIGAAGELAG